MTTDVLDNYLAVTKSSWSNGKYYLGGQLPLELDTIITNKHIEKVYQMNKGAGAPCNSAEAYSCAQHEKNFTDLLKLLKYIP